MAKMLFAQYKTPKIQGAKPFFSSKVAARMLPPPHHDWEVLYSLPLPPLEKSWTTKTHLLSQVCMASRNSSLANCFSNFCRASNSCKGNTARSFRPPDNPTNWWGKWMANPTFSEWLNTPYAVDPLATGENFLTEISINTSGIHLTPLGDWDLLLLFTSTRAQK